MTLRAKLSLMFFGALQVTFLTGVATFWALQSWQLLADDLAMIHEQNLRVEGVVEGGPHANGQLRALRRHAQTLEEVQLVDALVHAIATPGGIARDAAERLKRYYHNEVNRLREQSRFVTRLSTGLLIGIVALVLTGMMAYFAAIRVWLVRPIQALGRGTAVISTGDLEHRIPVAGRDEFAALGTSINTMAASLAEKQRRLVAAERFAAVGEMSAYVAHNIRNPLASIRATAQTELLDLPADDPRRGCFADIVTATDRLESWVGDLLRFSSPVTLARERQDLNALVERCAALVRPRVVRDGLQLALALDPALSPVSVDRNKMEQVVSAVLQNAIDASPRGGTIRVSSTLQAGTNGDGRACVRVEDAGPGIPAERLGSVFTLFGTTKKSGTGLGLALAQKIVTAHDGTITVTSRVGEGTAVEIALPTGYQSDLGSAERGEHPDR
jgi:signal transduction histidine kinase